MNYEELSDFDINKLVAEALGINVPKESNYISYGHNMVYSTNGYVNKVIVKDCCNNPSDAWPIIMENNIDLVCPLSDGGWVACDDYDYSQHDEAYEYFISRHKNPLRAAMIVFLKMQDKNNEKE